MTLGEPTSLSTLFSASGGNARKASERRVHRVASLLKRWWLDGISVEYYLDEFTFRFNRRTSRTRGLLFYRRGSGGAVPLRTHCHRDPVPIAGTMPCLWKHATALAEGAPFREYRTRGALGTERSSPWTLDEAEIEQARSAEIPRRVQEVQSGAVTSIPAEKVFAELDRLLEK
jgi:hypothetical protein